jgi:hypothetical protein
LGVSDAFSMAWALSSMITCVNKRMVISFESISARLKECYS